MPNERERTESKTPWHAMPVTAVLQQLDCSQSGLDDAEVRRRQLKYGKNELPLAAQISTWKILFRQFRSFVLLLLIGASTFSLLTNDTLEAAAILAIVFLNIALGFYQEWSAERATSSLRELATPTCKVRRAGSVDTLDARDLVPGDVILLEAGDHVPADARLFLARDVLANEAPLTGESQPVQKASDPVPQDTVVADRTSVLHMGTSVVRGYAEAVIVEIGLATELGHIAALLHNVAQRARSPLQLAVDRLSILLGWLSIGLVAVIFLLGVLRGEPGIELLIFAVSIAVAAVPEGLPAIVTVALALGVRRMASRKAIVRRLEAIETLGTATVICTDKTGTLTTGEMEVRDSWTHDPASLHLVFAGCETTHLKTDGGFAGDPTEAALLRFAAAHGVLQLEVGERYPEAMHIPFDSDRKMMTVVRKNGDEYVTLTKGAPDVIVGHCTSFITQEGPVPIDDHVRKQIDDQIEQFASQGMRVMAAATKRIGELESGPSEVESDLTLVGLAALADPPRPESKAMVESCHLAEIKVMMITGDHPRTALAIAKELGIATSGDQLLEGAALETLSTPKLRAVVENIRVYARVTAEHKLRIVEALKENNEIVAMTGDGVNDAPALAGSHIGMAMGAKGTDVAKDSSDIIIIDDNFATIARAVEYGRSAFANIRKSIDFLLTGNISELVLLGSCFVFGLPVPLTALRLLWINLITDGAPALALAAEGVQPGVMRQPPRRKGEGLTNRHMSIRMLALGVLNGAILWAFYTISLQYHSVLEAQTGVFLLLILSEMLRAISYRHPSMHVWRYSLRPSLLLLIVCAVSISLQFLIVLTATGRQVFQLAALEPSYLLVIVSVSLLPLLLAEGSKVFRKGAALQ